MSRLVGLALLLTVSACGANATAPQAPTTTATVPRATGTVTIELAGLRNDTGMVLLAMFTSPAGWPEDGQRAFARQGKLISGGAATLVFKGVPAGDCALAVLHDEDGDKRMKKNFIGMPKEGFGFSNNPDIGMGAPSFEKTRVAVPANGEVTIRIHMKYM